LTRAGGIDCAGTLVCMAEHRYLLLAEPAAARHHLVWLRTRAPLDGSVAVDDLGGAMTALRLLGPAAWQLLSRLPMSPPGLLAPAPGRVQRLSLGYAPALLLGRRDGAIDLHLPSDSALPLYRLLADAAGRRGLRHVGATALESLRVAAGLPAWGAEVGTGTRPAELGIEGLGGAAPARRLCVLRGGGNVDVAQGSMVTQGGNVAGVVTSTARAIGPARTLALAFLPTGLAASGQRLVLDGDHGRVPASVVGVCPAPH
ncbi:MAG: aminomethyltransferase family protein, partial [Planctomycetes bacterium]|nr:aminomethyltransferase family protein [Planctomycetota bacterium]